MNSAEQTFLGIPRDLSRARISADMNEITRVLERIQKGEIDPTFIITHRLPLDQAPDAYRMFRDKQDECLKVVLKP